MLCTKFWIAAAISFFVSMIFSLCTFVYGGVFLILMLMTVAAGWVLWVIGLVNYLRMR